MESWRMAFSSMLLLLQAGALATRTCPGHRVPALADRPLGFCTDYFNMETCLSPIGTEYPVGLYPSESTIADEFHQIQFDGESAAHTCSSLVKSLLCAAADPWADSLFEFGAGHDLIPSICPELAAQIWHQCSGVVMSPNPFKRGVASGSLADLFHDKHEFKKAFAKPSHSDRNCYSGVPVDQTKSVPTLPLPGKNYTGQICLQRLDFTVPSNHFLVGGAPYPTDRDLMAIIDKSGVISIWDMSKSVIEPKTLLDITPLVFSDGEAGVLGIAFHKEFRSNGRLFLSMTCRASSPDCKRDGDLVVDEYIVSEPEQFTTPKFERRILYIERTMENHFGGQLLFSPSKKDNNLYVFVGDGGQVTDEIGDPLNNAQNLETLLGKVLRINIDRRRPDVNFRHHLPPYVIPGDNPFLKIPGARHEIFAFGFRNPWRCSFDRRYSEFLFCGDLGQHTLEEVDRVIAGGNYGWRYYEGRQLYNTSSPLGQPPIVFPEIEYNRTGVPAAIIGGYVYRPEHKSSIEGTYFFADEFGKLFSAIGVPGSGIYRQTPSSGEWKCASDSPVPCGPKLGFIFSFFETARGDVYLSTSKAIFKIAEPGQCNLA